MRARLRRSIAYRFEVLAGRPSRSRQLVIWGAVLAMVSSLGIVTYAQATAKSASSPVGYVDSVTGLVGGSARVAGWTIDPDDQRVATQVHVYIDAKAGSGARGVNIGLAKLVRYDVADVFPQAGRNHGFVGTVTGLTPGPHTLYVYALNAVGAGGSTLLLTRAITVPGPSPIGSADVAQGNAGGFVSVSGWMLDPDVPTRSGQVHVYIDGQPGSGARKVSVGAALPRTEVATAHPTAGPNHGFKTTITGLTPGRHTLYFYGLNVAGWGDNVLLATKTATVPAMSGSTLPTNGVLSPNNSLTSTDGRYRLTMQGDGNLVERVTASGRVLWHSGTAAVGNRGARLVMQPDGNLVMSNPAGRAVWQTKSAGTGNGSRLVLQTDANLVNYNSGGHGVWVSSTKNDRLAPGEVLKPGQSIRSVNGAHTLTMQWDGNLVQKNRAGTPLWTSKTPRQPTAWAVSQKDGNFVVYKGSTPLWHTHTNGKTSGGTMVMQDGGRMVLVRGGVTTWASRPA
jgi:hypothetical protein